MSDADPQSDDPIMPASSVSDPNCVDDGSCAKCGYALRGLPDHGKCPECGEVYTPSTIRPAITHPGALELCVRFGWPIMALLLTLPMLAGGDRGYIAWWFLSPVLLLVMFINSLVQTTLVANAHIPEKHRRAFGRLASFARATVT